MISDDIVEKFDKINNHFALGLQDGRKCFRGKCPLHDGDNDSSLSIYKSGHTVNGIWKCYTGNCHEKYGKNIIGFIRGLLTVSTKKEVGYDAAVTWCEEFFGCKYESPIPDQDARLTKFINRITVPENSSFRLKPEEFLSRLGPATYFLKRGYKEETLREFKIGGCTNPAKPFYERVLVPHFDKEGYVIGAMGRSIYEKCELCKHYHNPNGICRKFYKWVNTENFPSYDTLYNFFGAKKYIDDTGIALITESSPNVWRLKEADFPMSVGAFGSKFSEAQKFLLDTAKCHTVVIVPDAGEPGRILVNQVHEQCQYTHNIVTINPSYKDDVGALNIETVKNIIGPYLDKIRSY
jgi:hypothetical protein